MRVVPGQSLGALGSVLGGLCPQVGTRGQPGASESAGCRSYGSNGGIRSGVQSWPWDVRRPEALVLSFLPPPEWNKTRTKGQKRSLLLKKPLRVDVLLENTSRIPAPKE